MRTAIRYTALLLFTVIRLFGQEEKKEILAFKGYLKDMQGQEWYGNFDSSSWANLIHNRMNLKWTFSSSLSIRLDLRNRIFVGSRVRKTKDFAQQIDQYPGLFDLSVIWVDEPSLVVHSVIDRGSVSYRLPKWDITIGRQRINWGMNTIWNPHDIFNAYNFLDFDYEERPGNDAVRIQHYPTENTTLEIAWKPGRERTNHIASVLYRFNRKKFDWQLLGGLYQTDLFVGAGWAGSIGEKGFKGECSYFHPYNRIMDTSGVLTASIMMDYTFRKGWYLSGSVLYNGKPTGWLDNGGIYTASLSAKSLFPFRFSVYTGLAKNIATIYNLTAAVVYSPDHHSLILFPSFSCNVSENLDVDLTLQSFFAQSRQAYRMQGTALYLRGKWSF